MALELVNSIPGEGSDKFVPGTPAVFSVKSPSSFVVSGSVRARLAISNVVHLGGVLPENNSALPADVAVAAPERATPSFSILPRMSDGPKLLIGPGTGHPVNKGVYEITREVEAYKPVLASVSFEVNSAWTKTSRYWSDATSLAPIYLGFEYGIRNTGLFVFPQAGGALIAGGPLHALNGPRTLQQAIAAGWDTLANGTQVTVYFYVDETGQTLELWTAVGSAAPARVASFNMTDLGEFSTDDTAFTQVRSGPSRIARLFFGNGGGVNDVVRITDFAIYPYAPEGVVSDEAQPGHRLVIVPDCPYTFAASDGKLPTAQLLGKWDRYGATTPQLEWWFQPGRKTTPTYVTLSKSGPGDAYLRRREPAIETRDSGFSVEAWMAGETDLLTDINVGFGLRVIDGQKVYQLTALEAELARTYALINDPTYPTDLSLGYYVVRDGTALAPVDYKALKLVRMTLDRARDELSVFVEDPDVPFMRLSNASTLTFPAPASMSLPTSGSVDFGILRSVDATTKMRVGALSYLNDYRAWEVDDGLPETAPTVFSKIVEGKNTIGIADGVLRIEKSSFGAATGEYTYYRRSGDFLYSRGFQIDFRCRVVSYTDAAGTSNAPSIWTGAGITVYLGSVDSPNDEPCKIHIGLFDCGPYGRKIAIVPGTGGHSDILQQTAKGRLYSADMQWMTLDSTSGTYRLVYRPGKAVELWNRNLIKDAPVISIPWDQFEPEYDPTDTDPAIAFGNFNSEVNCLSEWRYVRWGVSSGSEVELVQDLQSTDYVFDGRALLLVDAEED